MSTDSAQDASVTVQISNRRASDRGTDVRDHSSYRYEAAVRAKMACWSCSVRSRSSCGAS